LQMIVGKLTEHLMRTINRSNVPSGTVLGHRVPEGIDVEEGNEISIARKFGSGKGKIVYLVAGLLATAAVALADGNSPAADSWGTSAPVQKKSTTTASQAKNGWANTAPSWTTGQARQDMGKLPASENSKDKGPSVSMPNSGTITTPTGGTLSTNGVGGNGKITGPNGTSVSANNGVLGGANIKGPNGQSAWNNGVGKASGGGGPAGDGSKPHFNNGGTAGASDNAYNGPGTNTLNTLTGGAAGHPENGKDSDGFEWKNNQKWNGTDSDGLTWNKGRPWNGPDGNGGSYHNGHHIKGQGDSMPADMGDLSGGGERHVTPGNKGGFNLANKGGDAGGGQTDQGGSDKGGANAQGKTVNLGAVAGGDASPLGKKAQKGVLDTSRVTNGASDPVLSGGH
jgi:hypothetical protein